jgi:hypothetical protein
VGEVNREEWLRAFCEQIGVEPPTDAEAAELLELAAVAAHSSERPAAPLACWAAGRTGRPVSEFLDIAREVNPQDGPS